MTVIHRHRRISVCLWTRHQGTLTQPIKSNFPNRIEVDGSCRINKKRLAIKKRCVEYKGGGCIACGYDRCEQALVFHHINPDDKKFNISGKHCLSWEKIKMELDKCVLLCNRCHSELHAGLLSLGSDRTVTELVLYTNKLGSTPRLPTYEELLVKQNR